MPGRLRVQASPQGRFLLPAEGKRACPSRRPPALEQRPRRPCQDAKIKRDVSVPRIPEIEFGAPAHMLQRWNRAVRAVHLGPARKPGLDASPRSVVRDKT